MDIESLLKQNFICQSEEYCKLYSYINAPLFRKDFELKNFKKAELYICGLGFYELFLNGEKITKGKFASYISNVNHLVYYDCYDVTKYLTLGGNAICVLLGNGWLNPIGGYPWGFDKADWRSSPRLSLFLVVDDNVFLVSDDSFLVKDSHILFNDLRCGEYIDANLLKKEDYLFSKTTYGFFNAKKTCAPKGDFVLCDAEPIAEIGKKKPVSSKKVDGGIIFDFGENLAGVPLLKINGEKNQKIVLWHFEATLDGCFYNKNICTPDFDRSMAQKDVFICSGKFDVFEPSFTYHGFRYIFAEGLCDCSFSLEMVVLSSALNMTGHFSCSNDVVNSLQKITLNSDISNFFYFPTDCPQREKNGWTADASLSCEQMLFNFDCSNSLAVWLKNIRYAQRDDGQIPGVIPTFDFGYKWGNGPNWDNVLVELPFQIYKFTADKNIILDNQDTIYKYLSVNLLNRLNKDGLICFGLCDWCETASVFEDECSTPVEVTDTLACIDMLNKSAFLFEEIAQTEKAIFCKKFSIQLKNSFRNKYVDKETVICKTQTAQAMAIKVGVFDNIHLAENSLLNIIKKDDSLMKIGVVGSKYLFDVLAESGNGDLALQLMIQERFPSYNYWLKNGATSLWEAFNELENNRLMRKDGGRVFSLNHHFWGSISAFFYKYILGVNILTKNGKQVFYVKPYNFSLITKAEGSYIRNGKGVKVSIDNGKVFATSVGDTIVKILK